MDPLPIVLGIRCYPAGGSDLFIQYILQELRPYITATIVTVGNKPWYGPVIPPDNTLQKLGTIDPDALVYFDDWKDEISQGNSLLDFAYKEFPNTYLLLLDTDEIMDISTVKAGLELITKENADVCRFYQKIYWKSPMYVLQPDLQIQTIGLIKMDRPRVMGGLRHVADTKEVVLPWDQGVMHHMAYVRDNKTVKEKLAMYSHANEILPDWYEKVWLAWDQNPDLQNLHPITPNIWQYAILQHPRVLPKTIQTVMRLGSGT